MKLALALIVRPTDEEAVVLRRCLANVAPHVDQVFITITGENQSVRQVAEDFKAVISTTPWEHDFAKARNFSFAQVPKEFDYIMWCDADDAFRGIEKLKATIESHLDIDGFAMNYLYAFDENKNPIVVHRKTQVVRNDGSVEWAGKLHEDFKEHRELKVFFIKDIERLHLSTDERFESAKVRNLEVAKKQAESEPNDPRSYWNLGNAHKALNNNDECIAAFDKFLEMSQSDDEKYIARLRRAEAFWGKGELLKAVDEGRYAVGMKPTYPDAYHMLGSLYFELGRLDEAEQSYKMGLVKKPPYYSILVYNPRDYDFVPMMNLAKVYFRKSMPTLALPLLKACSKIAPEDEGLKKVIRQMTKEAKKFDEMMKHVSKLKNITDKEKLKAKINAIPEEFQSHPMVCHLRNIHFVKEHSSGKDMVIFCGFTEEEWSPETAAKKGIGGSEEAVINLAQKWAELGWNVTVYNNCGHREKQFVGSTELVEGRGVGLPAEYGDFQLKHGFTPVVTYKPFWSWNYRDKQDVVILWRSPILADKGINAGKIFVDLHDVIKEGEFTPERLEKIDKVFVKSQFHRSLFPNIPEEKIAVVPNGINAAQFEGSFKKNPKLIINTSSPDRSLSTFIEVAKEVKRQVPDAEFQWAYGWKVFDVVHNTSAERMIWKKEMQEKMKEVGVKELGRLSHDKVAELYKKAGIFLYPTEFAEIHCISALKAQAAGAIPITTDFAALNETVKYGTKIHSYKTRENWCLPYQFNFALQEPLAKEAFVKKVVEALKGQPDREEMREWARRFDWSEIAKEWANQF